MPYIDPTIKNPSRPFQTWGTGFVAFPTGDLSADAMQKLSLSLSTYPRPFHSYSSAFTYHSCCPTESTISRSRTANHPSPHKVHYDWRDSTVVPEFRDQASSWHDASKQARKQLVAAGSIGEKLLTTTTTAGAGIILRTCASPCFAAATALLFLPLDGMKGLAKGGHRDAMEAAEPK